MFCPQFVRGLSTVSIKTCGTMLQGVYLRLLVLLCGGSNFYVVDIYVLKITAVTNCIAVFAANYLCH